MGVAQIHKNRIGGDGFEKSFVHRAHLTDHWPIKQPLAYRFLRGGKKQAMRAELDFSLINRDGKIAYVDCKVVSADYFLKTRMQPFQVHRAFQYNLRNVVSGFVVYFPACNAVSFYTGLQLHLVAPKTRFAPDDGIPLGDLVGFDPGLIYTADLGLAASDMPATSAL